MRKTIIILTCLFMIGLFARVKAAGIPSYVELEIEENEGYVIASQFVFTRNIDKEKAMERLKPYMLFKDGEPSKEEFSITTTFDDTKKRVTIKTVFPDKTTLTSISPYQIIDSKICEYASATPYSFFRFAIVLDKDTIDKNIDFNSVTNEIIKQRFTPFILPEFDLKYNDSLLETNDIWSESFIRHGNLTYHKARANVRIIKDLTVPSFISGKTNNDTYMIEQINPSTVPNIESKSNKFTNNDIVRSITAGVITTIITYLLFVIVRGFIKTIKRRS